MGRLVLLLLWLAGQQCALAAQFTVGQRALAPVAAGHHFTPGTQTACSGSTSGATSITCTLSASVASATDVEILACTANQTTAFSSIGGSGVTSLYSKTGAAIAGEQIFAVVTATAGTTSLTINLAATSYSTVYCSVMEAAGVVSSGSPVDVAGSAWAASSYATGISTGSVTTANANDVAIGIAAYCNSGTTWTAGTGYTAMASTASSDHAFFEYQTVSATGSYNPGITQGTSGNEGVLTVALQLR